MINPHALARELGGRLEFRRSGVVGQFQEEPIARAFAQALLAHNYVVLHSNTSVIYTAPALLAKKAFE